MTSEISCIPESTQLNEPSLKEWGPFTVNFTVNDAFKEIVFDPDE